MTKIFQNKQSFYLLAILGIAIFTAVFFVSRILIDNYEHDMRQSFEFEKETGISYQRKLAQDRINSLYTYLEAENNNVEKSVIDKAKLKADNAFTVAASLYAEYEDKTKVKDEILDLLKILSQDDGRGYFFVIDYDGKEISDSLGVKYSDKYGQTLKKDKEDFIKRVANTAKTTNEGYLNHICNHSLQDNVKPEKQMVYIKKFEPLKWIICRAEYVKDNSSDKQEELLNKLKNVRFGEDSNNYIFIYKLHNLNGGKNFATMVLNPNRPDLEGKSIDDDVKDAAGKEYRKEMLKAISLKEGIFVDYLYKTPSSGKIEKKLSYFKYYKEWDWIVATGVYLGEINKNYDHKLYEFNKKIENNILVFRALFVFLAIIIFIAGYTILIIQKNIMRKSAIEIEQINRKLKKQAKEEIEKRMEIEKENSLNENLLIQHAKMAELGKIISLISHQWKQPLNAISLLAQELKIMQQFNELNEDTVNDISHTIDTQISYMSQTITDFTNFIKPDKEKKDFLVHTGIENILKIFSVQIKTNNIKVDFERPDRYIEIFGVENEFKQVVLNILNNAKDALLEMKVQNPMIKIRTSDNKGICIVSIEDNAGGIKEELLPNKIFENFISTKGENGPGTGLYLAKIIIEKSFEGKLSAENINGGARFTIEINETNKEIKNMGIDYEK